MDSAFGKRVSREGPGEWIWTHVGGLLIYKLNNDQNQDLGGFGAKNDEMAAQG